MDFFFNSDFPKLLSHPWNSGRCSENTEWEECTAVTLRRKLSREGRGGCCDCWHLWPLFHLRKRWTGFSVAALPWRGSGGGLLGPQPERAVPSQRCSRMWRVGRGAQVAQITGGAGWPVTPGNVTAETPGGDRRVRGSACGFSVWSEWIVMLYVFPPFLISSTRDSMKRVETD